MHSEVKEQCAQCPKVALVFHKESSNGPSGPVLHRIGKHLHGHLIVTEVVANKDHSLHLLLAQDGKGGGEGWCEGGKRGGVKEGRGGMVMVRKREALCEGEKGW